MTSLSQGGVVDLQLRVYGVQGLRIADASVFPELVGMKPQATIVMVGEKCAEMLIAEARGSTL
jgi:choline dehydrogenase